MACLVKELGAECLPRYGEIPISFLVESVLRVELVADGLGGIVLREEKLQRPYVKDYDACGDEGPTRWAKKFDISKWGIFMALEGDHPIGGATVAFDTPAVYMLGGRKDLAVLWDIRVHPDYRRRGVGSELFEAAVDWARRKGCKQFKVETQNVNAAACHFYQKQGCKLGAINRYGYYDAPEAAGETMLLWYLDL